MRSPVEFTAVDSGTANLAIDYRNYPGETPVFSGGTRVVNWTNTGGNTWKTTLPASTQYFENLFYNGAPRLGGYLGTYYRYASTVYLKAPGQPAKAPDPNCSVYINGSGCECFDRFQYDPKDPISDFAVQPKPDSTGKSPCSGNTNDWTFYTFAQWQQKVGEDLQSVVQNPGFANPAYPTDDYSLPLGSAGVGFVPFDPSQAGRINPIISPPPVPATFPTKLFNPATDY